MLPNYVMECSKRTKTSYGYGPSSRKFLKINDLLAYTSSKLCANQLQLFKFIQNPLLTFILTVLSICIRDSICSTSPASASTTTTGSQGTLA